MYQRIIAPMVSSLLLIACINQSPVAWASNSQVKRYAKTSTGSNSQGKSKYDLQEAVDLIDKNPKQAEQELLTMSRPTAKVYLAYLYMSNKITVPDAAKKIDTLMNDAIANVPEPRALGKDMDKVDNSKHYHYTDMNMFLMHLRFITDADEAPVEVPASIFEQYPRAAFDAFRSVWGSSLDINLAVDIPPENDIETLPEISRYVGTLGAMLGELSGQCTGTIRFGQYRQRRIALVQASLAPQLFDEDLKGQERGELDRFLQTWGNQELWNKQMYQQLTAARTAALLPLSKLYEKHFHFSPSKAESSAKTALDGIGVAYLGGHPHQAAAEAAADPVYQLFSKQALSVTDMKTGLADKTLSMTELSQALRLAILNAADIEVIQQLVELGAPLLGGIETPLSSAVLRPDVVSFLLKSGAQVDEANQLGKTALFQAAQYNEGETIRILLEGGADVNHAMVAADGTEAQEANSNCNFNYEVGNRTPLMYAAAFANSESIMLLLSKGANKNAVDSKGTKVAEFLSWNKKLPQAEKDNLTKVLQTH